MAFNVVYRSITMRKFSRVALTITFSVVMLFPIIFLFLPKLSISGAFEESEPPVFSTSGLIDGSFQSSAETYIREHIPGREYMIKTKNQFVFDLFDKSPVETVIVGKNGQMFSQSFIYLWYQLHGPTTDEFIDELSTTIEQFHQLMEKNGKNMLIYITPTKVRYYEDDVPDKYRFMAPRNPEKSAYEKLLAAITPLNIPVFDSIAFLDTVRDGTYLDGYPLFSKTGTHWSQSTGSKVAVALGDYLETAFHYDLPEMTIDIKPSDTPVFPDADIFNLLNIYTRAYDSYTEPMYTITEPGGELPRLLCRGGSFMGQSLAHLVLQGYFASDICMENTQFFEEKFTKITTLNDYGDFDLKSAFENTDLVIIEVNEMSVDVMSFGFMQYVLEHQHEIFP